MESIKEKIIYIIKKKFDLKVDITNKDNIFFLSNEIGFNSRQMVYLVLCAEKEYGIKLAENVFDDEDFYNLNGFCKKISECLVKAA